MFDYGQCNECVVASPHFTLSHQSSLRDEPSERHSDTWVENHGYRRMPLRGKLRCGDSTALAHIRESLALERVRESATLAHARQSTMPLTARSWLGRMVSWSQSDRRW